MISANLSRNTSLAAALVLAAVVSCAGIGSHSLWTPDEPTGSAVGRAMFTSGDLVVPRLNGRPFLEKPPLYWWTQVASFHLFGVSDRAARVPSALFEFLTLVATYGLGRRLASPRAGLLAVAVLATTVEFSEDMARVVVDPALVFFVTLMYAGFAVLVAPRSARERQLATLLIAAAAPLAFLAKGIVALGLGLGPPVLYVIWSDRAQPRRAPARLLVLAVIGVPLFAAAVLPWMFALYDDAGWTALRECLIGNTVGRFFNTEALRVYGHREPSWFYATAGLAAAAPWILALPAMLRAGLWRRTDSTQHDGAARRLLIVSCGIGVLLLSAAASKRALYLVPLLPAFAVCVGWWADGAVTSPSGGATRDRSWDRPTMWLLMAVATALPLAALVAVMVVRLHSWPADSLSVFAPVAGQLTTVGIAVVGGVAALAVVLFGVGIRRHVRAGTTPSVGAIVSAYLMVFLAYQTIGKAFIDPLKNLHDLTAAIARFDPGGAPVYAYRPSESLLAIVNFDLARTVQPLMSPDEMSSLFAHNPDEHVVVAIEVARTLPPAIADRLRYVYDETGRKASPVAIVEWRR